MKIILVRHGESKLNVLRVHQGPDTELSDNGLKQADSVAKRLVGTQVDLIICSKYKRAMQTAQIIGKVIKKKINYTDFLNEMKRPTETLGMELESEKSLRISQQMRNHMNEPDWHYSDEENFSDLRKRAEKAVNYIGSKKKESVLVVTHANMIKMMISFGLFGKNMKPEEFYRTARFLHATNTGITECEIDEEGEWKLITYNDYTHLR